MNTHALALLEYPRVLSLVAGRAGSEVGAERVRAVQPLTEITAIEAEHARTTAMRALLESERGWTAEPLPPLSAPLRRLAVEGAALTGEELLAVLTLLKSSRRTRSALQDDQHPAAARGVLAPFVPRLVSDEKLERPLERALADDGTVRDEASQLLRRLRRELRASHGELVRILERVVAKLARQHAVHDMSVTVRNGRYVIPIRREARSVVGGIVHDASATGATLFVEPPAAVEFGNRIRELEAEEAREVDRVLLELTDGVRPCRDALTGSLDALAELDSLYARARFARDFRCEPVELGDPRSGFAIFDGRHPLLVAQGIDVVPFDLEMLAGERTLLVSGPNTGGKTVLLKAVGLISAMAQAGIPVPVGKKSRVAVFDDVFADIGDEQSIEASLSTFSAHLRNLSEILRSATPQSLALIDELGSGTDPLEGAALGGAILEELTTRGTLTLATTHLGALKQLATETTGVVNASLQFDAVQLAPTYRLIKGIPGRSYGIGIARRLNLPARVIDRAEERLPSGERDAAALLTELERREAELTEREREARASMQHARERAHSLASREKQLVERERALERESRREARRYVLEARAEIERTIKDLRSRGEAELDEAARAARRDAERLATQQSEALERLESGGEREGAAAGHGADGRLEPGAIVEVDTLGGRTGRLLEVREADALVVVGGMKLAVPVAALRVAERQEPEERAVTLVGSLPEEYVQREIDLRGMRVDEIDAPLMSALDAAIRADLKSLRIIHGKGTGALRSRVAEMLAKDVRVKGHRPGAWNEGGVGVTVVELA